MIKVICENGKCKEAALEGCSHEEVLEFIYGTSCLLKELAQKLSEDGGLEYCQKFASAFVWCLSDLSPSFIDNLKSEYLSLLEDYEEE